MRSAARRGVSTPAARADCGVPGGAAEFGDVAGAAARGWVWFMRWQGAVRVVDGQCRRNKVVQFLLVLGVNPFLNSVSVVSVSKTMVGWRLAEIGA